MSDSTRTFKGAWITTEEFALLSPLQVFHRQLDKTPLEAGSYQNKHSLFRKKFQLEATGQATLFITADDYYKLYINGRFVTQGPAPGYPFHYYYNKLDVTAYLQPGENTIAVHTYYQGLINRVWVSGDNRHGLLLDLTADGKTVLQSDESFLYAYHTGFSEIGTAGYQTQFLEKYDSNAPEVNFQEPDFDDHLWQHAKKRQNLDYVLFQQPTKQLDVSPVPPISLIKTATGYRMDFGSQYVGYVSLQAEGVQNSEVVIRCGQELQADGSVRFNMRANCRYEEKWVLSGKTDTLNQYDYKSFRYVELLLPPACTIKEDSVCLVARHYPFAERAVPHTSDPVLLQVWNLCSHSLQWGVQEVIQDCMEREKGQYLGDGCYSSLSLALLTKDTSMMEKLIDDSLRTAFVNKGLMTCTTCSFMQEIAEYSLMLPWLVLAQFAITGDKQFLADRFDAIRDIPEYYRTAYAGQNGLLYNLDKWCVVEWPPEARDGYDVDLTEGQVCREVHNVINAYYIGAVKAVNKIAGILGKEPYGDQAALQKTFIDAFYDPNKKLFRDSVISSHISLPGNAFALLFALCPDKQTDDNIVEMIRQKKLSASMFFVTFAVLAALKRVGQDALCMELLADPHGWLNMLREGATTTLEGWGKDAKWNTSLFHLAFTYPIVFLTQWNMEVLFDKTR